MAIVTYGRVQRGNALRIRAQRPPEELIAAMESFHNTDNRSASATTQGRYFGRFFGEIDGLGLERLSERAPRSAGWPRRLKVSVISIRALTINSHSRVGCAGDQYKGGTGFRSTAIVRVNMTWRTSEIPSPIFLDSTRRGAASTTTVSP